MSQRPYYDAMQGRRLADYVYGNRRAELAIQHALAMIRPDSKRILDVGCGIGWSTSAIKREHCYADVVGIDLSQESIKTAQTVFAKPGISFVAGDVTTWADYAGSSFDAIILLDVYEHVLRERRSALHSALDLILSRQGLLVLTFPSLLSQRAMRTCHRTDRQPVDEDVSFRDMADLAEEIGGTVTYYRHVDVWHTNDYVHITIEREPKHFPCQRPPHQSDAMRLSSVVGQERISAQLGVRTTRYGFLLPDRQGPVICVVDPTYPPEDTFIKAHFERLPARVRMLVGGPRNYHREDDSLLLPASRMHRVVRLLARLLLKRDENWFSTRSLKRFLKENGVTAVLAEYGPTGVALMGACNAAGVPLVVHFHGYDAYLHATLERYGEAYRGLFDVARAVIVPSRHMEDQLLTMGAKPDRLFYSPYGADTTLFCGADPSSVGPHFVAAGRFTEKKAPHLTLLAFRRVLDKCSDATMLMIGDGPLLETCKQLSEALELGHAVEFAGHLPQADVAHAMVQARAFVQHSLRPSSGDSEGTPVVILEAGAAGLPVVSTRHAGIIDAVIHHETGLLVDEGDVRGMAEHMIALAKDPKLAAALGSHARQHIETNFSLEGSISRLWCIIERAAES